MGDLNPIATSNELNASASSLANLATTYNLNINAKNTLNNIDSQILLKKDHLIKIKNQELNEQIKHLQNYESSIINKDRLIEETNLNINNNDRNITVLIFSIVFSIILCIFIFMYVYNSISPKLFNLLLILIVIMYVILFLYAYNIFYFKTVVNFFDLRKNRNIENTVKNWSKFTNTDLQKKLYGDKTEWLDENCDCEEAIDILPNEQNISVKQIPGLYYYDKNSPKQLIVGNDDGPDADTSIINKGREVDISNTSDKTIYDKIDWVNHDNYGTNVNIKQTGVYTLNSNIGNSSNNGFNNSSTYTANL